MLARRLADARFRVVAVAVFRTAPRLTVLLLDAAALRFGALRFVGLAPRRMTVRGARGSRQQRLKLAKPIAHVPRSAIAHPRRAPRALADFRRRRRRSPAPTSSSRRRAPATRQPFAEHELLDPLHVLDVALPVEPRALRRLLDADARKLFLPGAQHVGLHLQQLADFPGLEQLGQSSRVSITAVQTVARGAVGRSRSPPASRARETGWRALESEPLPELVHEKPLVGEVELRRDVGEEHERRRRHAGLRRIEDAHVRRPGLAGGCAAVISATNLFSSGVLTRFCRDAATRSIASSSFGARSPVSAEMWRIGA